MSIAKPFTFVAGQKARANEVNADFDALYSQVNINIADIAQINRDVDGIESTKADINGNSTQRFAVANPVNSTDAVNKQTMKKSLTNVLDFINGLIIEKDSASPNDTILVNPGSCYDSTKQVVLELANITSKKNEGQGASTTYYVYIIGNETGSSIDIIISNSSVEPTLPTGYTKFRNIGNFTTDSDNHINKIYNYSNTSLADSSDTARLSMPNYSSGTSVSINTIYKANTNLCLVVQSNSDGHRSYVDIGKSSSELVRIAETAGNVATTYGIPYLIAKDNYYRVSGTGVSAKIYSLFGG